MYVLIALMFDGTLYSVKQLTCTYLVLQTFSVLQSVVEQDHIFPYSKFLTPVLIIVEIDTSPLTNNFSLSQQYGTVICEQHYR